jgi:hypothetical protein
MKNENFPRLVLIEWVDSAQPVPGWHFLDQAPDMKIIKCASVGWLVGDSDGVKMLAPNVGNLDSDESTQASGFIRIPMQAVLREVCLVEDAT